MNIKRGDVYLADLSPITSAEYGEVRPVLVVQNDIGNRFSPTIIVAAITSQIQRAKLPTHVEINADKYDFPKDSVILLEQLRTIDKMRLKQKVTSFANVKEIMDSVSLAYNISGGTIPLDKEEAKQTENQYEFTLDCTVDFMEDHEYEFKEIKGNPKNAISSNVSEYATSFLNSFGGRIFYGITNERLVKGFEATPEMIDELHKVIYSSLRNIDPGISSDGYEINFHPILDQNGEEIKQKFILEVSVPVSPHKNVIHFNKGKDLYIRSKGVKELLKGSEIVTFISNRLKRVEEAD